MKQEKISDLEKETNQFLTALSALDFFTKSLEHASFFNNKNEIICYFSDMQYVQEQYNKFLFFQFAKLSEKLNINHD